MSIKKQLYAILLFLLCSPVFAQDNGALLWKIEGKDLKYSSYLYGTMHVKDNRAFNIGDSTYMAIRQCDVFALEVHLDSLMKAAFYKRQREGLEEGVDDYLSESEYKALKEKFKDMNGFDLEALDNQNPMLVESLMRPKRVSPDDQETFVDAYLFGIARNLEKEVIGLEEVEDQLRLLSHGTREEKRRSMLRLIRQDTSAYLKSLDRLIETYSTNNLDSIEKALGSFNLTDSILIQRNHVMQKSIKAHFKDRSVFAAIGAAHLLGKNGLIELFRQEGYTVRPVYSETMADPEDYKIDYGKQKWFKYSDTLMAYEVETPSEAYEYSEFVNSGFKIYPDLVSGVVFMHYALDIRRMKAEESDKKIIQNFIDQLKKESGFELLSKSRIQMEGVEAAEAIFSLGRQYFKYLFIIRENNLYGLVASSLEDRFEGEVHQRFFDSFRLLSTAQEVNKDWMDYQHGMGAFSVRLPSQPKLTVNNVQYPGAEGVEVPIYIFMAIDMANSSNYLIAYNDFPIGYYLEDQSMVLNAGIEELTQAHPKMSEVDTIWRQGIEGREVDVMLQNRFYCKLQLFTRGNRIYKVMKQNLKPDEKGFAKEDGFFNSFSFLPYKSPQSTMKEIDSLGIRLMQFDLAKEESTDADPNSYLQHLRTFYTTNPNSGVVYLTEVSRLSKYHRIHSVDSFYVDLVSDFTEWSDTLLSLDTISIDGISAREFYLQDRYKGAHSRIRAILNPPYFYSILSYSDLEGLKDSTSQEYFDALHFTPQKEEAWQAVYSSKSDLILAHLKSEDTLLFKGASGALNYYHFDSSDVPKLKLAVQQTYGDDTSTYGSKIQLIDLLGQLKGMSAEEWQSLYQAQEAEHVKKKILYALIDMEDHEGISTFTQLFFTAPPKIEFGQWKMTHVFSDSIALMKAHFSQLIALLDNEDYNSSLLSVLSGACARGDEELMSLLNAHSERLLRNAATDLDTFVFKKENNGKYYYMSEIDNYLNFMQYLDIDLQQVDHFTERLMGLEKLGYLEAKVIEVRMVRGLPLKAKLLKARLKDEDTRLSTIRAYHAAGRMSEISETYLQRDEVARLILSDELDYDEGAPDHVSKLGEIEHGDSLFMVMKFGYDYSGNNYVGIVGPFKGETGLDNFPQIESYTDWEKYDENWMETAKKQIEAFEE